jgi:hypothetical protein
VAEENVKLQVVALRKALGSDPDLIHTEFGRGYRFIGVARVNAAATAPECLRRERLRSAPTLPASGGAPGRPPAGAGVPGVGRGAPSRLRLFRSCHLGRGHCAVTFPFSI